MADNTTLDAGSGGDIIAAASLTISGDTAKVQMIGVGILSGSEGSWSYTQVPGGSGSVDAGTPRVTLASDDPAVVSLAILDDWDDGSDRCRVVGAAAHDAAAAGNPLLLGAYGKAAAPSDVSADADAVHLWALLNGALCINVTAAGALIGGDATNGLDVDVTRVTPGTTATALGKAEDAAHTSGDVGVMALSVRQDTAAALAGTDADYQPLITDGSGRLHVNVGACALPTGAATAAKQPALGTAGTASSDVISVQGIASMTPLLVTASAGTNLNTSALALESGGNLATIAALSKAEDAAHSSGHTGVFALAVRSDTAAQTAGADGDYCAFISDSSGRLHVNVGACALPTGAATAAKQPALGTAGTASSDVITVQGIASMTPLLVTASAGTNLNTSALALETGGNLAGAATSLAVMDDWDNGASDGASVSGDVAHDSADAGEPVKIGAKAIGSPKGLTLVAANDRTNAIADLDGILIAKLGTSGADHISERVSNTDGASTAFSNFDATASTYNAVTAITVFRTDSGSSMAYVDFRDGTAGAVLYTLPLPAGGGCTVHLSGQPLFKTSANTALAFDVSSALTTVYISITGFKTKA